MYIGIRVTQAIGTYLVQVKRQAFFGVLLYPVHQLQYALVLLRTTITTATTTSTTTTTHKPSMILDM